MLKFLRRFLGPDKRDLRREVVVARPSLTISEIEVRGGAKLTLEEDDFVLVVGPNNVGKSALLRDIKYATEHDLRGRFVTNMKIVKRGSPLDFKLFVDQYFEEAVYKDDGRRSLASYGALFKRPTNPEEAWRNEREGLGDIFCNLIETGERLSGSDAPRSFDPRAEPPKHPIHLMYLDTELEGLISDHFRAAFGEDLILYRMGGDRLPLYVGTRPELAEGDDLTSADYVKEVHRTAVPLSEQGDGVRSYATILTHAFGSIAASVLLLDEPEAFLHPPQARLLAETLSSSNLSVRQFFVATHSADVLTGLLTSQSRNVKIVKLGRSSGQLSFHVLDKARTAAIARDPLLKYSGVLGAVFHRRTFVCEGDSDCLFYNAILDIPSVRSNAARDALFIHAGGKHRLPQLMAALKTLDVHFDVICDIDVLRDEGLLEKVVLEAGGDWNSIEKTWRAFSADVNGTKKDIPDDIIVTTLQTLADEAAVAGGVDDKLRTRIRQATTPMSLWEEIKEGGAQAIPAGQASERFRILKEKLSTWGVWIVPVGTLEGFCKSVPGKTGWVQRVLESKALETDEELGQAREFVSAIWAAGPRSEHANNDARTKQELLPVLEPEIRDEEEDERLRRRKASYPPPEWRPFRPSGWTSSNRPIRRG